MGFFENVKMLWQNRSAIGTIENAVVEIKNDAVKSGWKTSEFWGKTVIQLLSVASIFVPALNVSPNLVLQVVAGIEAVYTLVRTFHKSSPPQSVVITPVPAALPAATPLP